MTLSWLPVAPEATKLSVVPLTVMVSPGAKPAASEFEPDVPDSAVAPVIGARRRRLVVDGAVPIADAVGVEEIVAGGDRRCRHQRGVGERRDPLFSAVLRFAAVCGRRRADGKASGRQRRRRCSPSARLDSVVPSGTIEGDADVVAGIGVAAGEIDRERHRRAGRTGDRRTRQRRRAPTSSFNPNGEPGDVFGDHVDVDAAPCRRGVMRPAGPCRWRRDRPAAAPPSPASSPACVVVPLMMSSAEATAGVLMAVPEKI